LSDSGNCDKAVNYIGVVVLTITNSTEYLSTL